jgi:hypothetical protein
MLFGLRWIPSSTFLAILLIGSSSIFGQVNVLPASVIAPPNAASATFAARAAANATAQQVTITGTRDVSTATSTITINASGH